MLTFKMKNNFFDRVKVIDYFGAAGKKSLAALSRFGAYLRRVARNSLKRIADPRKSADAGRPPYIHTDDETITLKNIQFAYDFSSQSMLVGSVLTNSSKARGSQTVPNLLEAGGTTKDANGRPITIAPHPWMGPALERSRSKLPEQWAAAASVQV